MCFRCTFCRLIEFWRSTLIFDWKKLLQELTQDKTIFSPASLLKKFPFAYNACIVLEKASNIYLFKHHNTKRAIYIWKWHFLSLEVVLFRKITKVHEMLLRSLGRSWKKWQKAPKWALNHINGIKGSKL